MYDFETSIFTVTTYAIRFHIFQQLLHLNVINFISVAQIMDATFNACSVEVGRYI
jgi:hypothetical protein